MFKKKNKKNLQLEKFLAFTAYFGFLLAINVVFFLFYYHGLSLNFSFFTLFFVFLFVLNYVLSLQLFQNRFFRAIAYFCLAAVVLFALINFAYYEVFGAFWRLSTGQLGQVNTPLVQLLSSYYVLIPFYIYVGAGLLFFGVMFATKIYFKKNDTIFRKIKRFYHGIDFIKLKKKKEFKIKLVIFFSFIILNCIFYSALHLYQIATTKQEFSREKYFSDLGPYGYLYNEFSKFLVNKTKKPPEVTLAETIEKNSPSVTPIISDLDMTKMDLEKINALTSKLDQPAINLNNTTTKPHVIIYQMESVAAWPLNLNPTPMPFLQKLINDNISVDSFYSNSCITINAEFSSLCSFYPEASGPVSDLFSYNNYYCLPSLLKDKFDYQTSIYHANSEKFWNRGELAPRWGFNNLYFTPHYDLRENDADVLSEVVKNIKKSNQPTFNYVIGFTSHGPHNQAFINYNLERNKLVIKPYESPLPDFAKSIDQDSESVKIYLGFLTAVDDGIKRLFDELNKNDLLKNTIVVIYGDHRYYNFYTDNKFENYLNYNQIPLAIYVPGNNKLKPAKIASQIDIAPTLLEIIAGKSYPMPINFIGQSIFSDKHANSAVNKCLGQSTFINHDIIVTHDNYTEGNYLFTSMTDSGKNNFYQYSTLLQGIADRSDKIMKENKLVDINTLKQSENILNLTNASKVVDLSQETDSDRDGLSDLRENTINTDPNKPDTDGDGFLDGVEVMFGWDPLSAEKF